MHYSNAAPNQRAEAMRSTSLDFYYCIEYDDYEQGEIFRYTRKGMSKPSIESVLKVSLDIPFRRFYVTEDYVLYCDGSHMTYLYNRSTGMRHLASRYRTSNHLIIREFLLCRHDDDGIALGVLPLSKVPEYGYPDESEWCLVIQTAGVSSHYIAGDSVMYSNGGYFHREWTEMGWRFSKTDIYGKVLFEKTIKCEKDDITAFTVCNDNIFYIKTVEFEMDDWPQSAQEIRVIRCDDVSQTVEADVPIVVFKRFWHHMNNPHIQEICVTNSVIAVRIWKGERDWDNEGIRVEFYSQNGEFIAKVIGEYNKVFTVADGVFILSPISHNNSSSLLCYVHDNGLMTEVISEGAVVVQPVVEVK